MKTIKSSSPSAALSISTKCMVHPFPFSVICAVGFYTAAAADNDSARSTCTICVTERMGTTQHTQKLPTTAKPCESRLLRKGGTSRARSRWPLTMFKWEKMYDVCLVYNANALRWIHTQVLVRIFVLLKQRTRSTHVCKRKRTIAFESDDASDAVTSRSPPPPQLRHIRFIISHVDVEFFKRSEHFLLPSLAIALHENIYAT